jgi:hypothetical protein
VFRSLSFRTVVDFRLLEGQVQERKVFLVLWDKLLVRLRSLVLRCIDRFKCAGVKYYTID